MSYAEIEMKIVQWGESRGIVQNGKPVGQARKTSEEAAELMEATAKLDAIRELMIINPTMMQNREAIAYVKQVMDEAKDAVGDVLVTLIMVCATMDIDVVKCLSLAYEEIKDRKGYLRPDGVFVKQT